VRGALATFRTHRGRAAQSFSMGGNWMNDDTMQLVESLGVRYELTIPPGTPAGTLAGPHGKYTGESPDYRKVPRAPWRPSVEDFRLPAVDGRGDGILAIPLSTIIPGWRTRPGGTPRAKVAQLLGRRPRTRSTRLLLRSGPQHFRRTFEHELARRQRQHFLFSIRASIFAAPHALERMTAGLDYILSHPQAHRFVFATPRETIELLASADS